ncbi:MAG: hypothetical protein V4537_02280 [Pseudomonadota bacterium]
MKSLRLALLAPLALLGACGSDDMSQPGGITAGEAQELNDAAAMLDANAVELNAVVADGNAS